MLQEMWSSPVWPLHFGDDKVAASATLRPMIEEQSDRRDEPATWADAAKGVEARALVQGPEMVMIQQRLARGATLPIHTHRSSEAGYVLEGKLLITLPDEQLTVSAGQCYMLPAGVPHQVRATAKTVAIGMFAPGRALATQSAAEVVRGLADVEAEATPHPRPRAFGAASRRSVAGRSRSRHAASVCPALASSGDAA